MAQLIYHQMHAHEDKLFVLFCGKRRNVVKIVRVQLLLEITLYLFSWLFNFGISSPCVFSKAFIFMNGKTGLCKNNVIPVDYIA